MVCEDIAPLKFKATCTKSKSCGAMPLLRKFLGYKLLFLRNEHSFVPGQINKHFLPPGVACTTGLSHNPFTWRPL